MFPQWIQCAYALDIYYGPKADNYVVDETKQTLRSITKYVIWFAVGGGYVYRKNAVNNVNNVI